MDYEKTCVIFKYLRGGGAQSNKQLSGYAAKKSAFTLAEVFHPAGKSRRIAFTLAEVLITLGIIGVVAALTMPTLISNHKKKVLSVRARKAYSTIAQAIKLYQAQEESPGDVTGLFDVTKNTAEVTDAFAKYFKTVKICSAPNSCDNLYYKNGKKLYNADNKTGGPILRPGTDVNAVGYFYLADGTMIGVKQSYGSCLHTETGFNRDENGFPERDTNGDVIYREFTLTNCAAIYFDTNGTQGPNQLGVDAFKIRVAADGSIPFYESDKTDVVDGGRNLLRILNGQDMEDVQSYNLGEEFKE